VKLKEIILTFLLQLVINSNVCVYHKVLRLSVVFSEIQLVCCSVAILN